MASIKILWEKSVDTIHNYGIKVFFQKMVQYIDKVKHLENHSQSPEKMFMDVLFINGCYLPHPSRYRVSHQREQLLANGMSSNEVFYEDVTLDLVKRYRLFIFFRCPYTETIGTFIQLAKEHHKTVLFDIDDLVIDTKYTNQIKYVQSMSPEDKTRYDSGVERMKKTLCLCDGAITTTERLAEELSHYVPEVYINRNVASDRMVELSEWAVFDRDTAPTLSVDQAETRKNRSHIALLIKKAEARKSAGHIAVGYFSGSITHNDDIQMILPALVKILTQYDHVDLHFVGELDLPEELEPFRSRVIARPFVSWEELPQLIASVDINIAPLEQGVFNEAKSENKWVEAALVKVPTVASRIGAFEKRIEDGKTGLLCGSNEEWYRALSMLIEQPELRKKLAAQAYSVVQKKSYTLYTGKPLMQYLRSKMASNLVMVLPSIQISGGVLVALKHCIMLTDAGLDVTILNDGVEEKDFIYEGRTLFVVSNKTTQVHLRIDKAVATLWATAAFLSLYPNIEERYYLVQNFETNFYKPGTFFRFSANQTYSAPIPLHYITISKWCEDWLTNDYGQTVSYAPNGINLARFPRVQRNFGAGKVRILVEGNSDDFYKNVDESFHIVEQLNLERFEIWFMSYQGKPKSWYHVDKFLHKIPNEQVGEVYAACDILLKSSRLESFSYPPLEMMATGGFVVAAPNEGNVEYLKHEENCLLYEQGDLEAAVQAIERICADTSLRDTLYAKGFETAEGRDWSRVQRQILSLYHALNGENEC